MEVEPFQVPSGNGCSPCRAEERNVPLVQVGEVPSGKALSYSLALLGDKSTTIVPESCSCIETSRAACAVVSLESIPSPY